MTLEQVGQLLWGIWILYFAVVETYALITNEVRVPTLSRTIWMTFNLDDRGFDRAEVGLRIVLSLIGWVLFGWLVFHLAWGPCEFGYDWLLRSCR